MNAKNAHKARGHRIEVYGPTDDHGRCSFTLFWMADYHPGHPLGEHRHAERGQHFFARPADYGYSAEDVRLARGS